MRRGGVTLEPALALGLSRIPQTTATSLGQLPGRPLCAAAGRQSLHSLRYACLAAPAEATRLISHDPGPSMQISPMPFRQITPCRLLHALYFQAAAFISSCGYARHGRLCVNARMQTGNAAVAPRHWLSLWHNVNHASTSRLPYGIIIIIICQQSDLRIFYRDLHYYCCCCWHHASTHSCFFACDMRHVP